MSKRERHKLLTEAGAVLVRATKHEIWRLNGHTIVTGCTISDRSGSRQNIQQLIRKATRRGE